MKKWALLLLLWSIPAMGANWYVSKGASGTNAGTSWTNAWNEMNQINMATVACGDTIWLAGGSYTTTIAETKVCTSGSPLTINRVLSTDSVPVAAPGWSSGFDSTVNIAGATATVNGDYNILSGRIAGGIVGTTTVGGGNSVSGATTRSITGNELHYIKMVGPACAPAGTCTTAAYGVNIAPSTNTVTGLVVDHCEIYNMSELFRESNWQNATISYNTLHDMFNDGVDHEDVVYNYTFAASGNVVWKYNVIYNSPNDGVFFEFGGANNFIFYRNVFWGSGFSLMTTKAPGTYGPIKLYDNVFAAAIAPGGSCSSNCAYVTDNGSTMTGVQLRNNVFWFVGNSLSGNTGEDSDYNAYSYTSLNGFSWPSAETHSFTFNSSTQNPFNNVATGDFTLKSNSTVLHALGQNLGSPYNVDLNGVTAPASGGWDVGAYTFTAGTTYTITAPHYTMHQGDPVPPCIIQISNGTTIVSESSTLFTGAANCTMGATSSSVPGNYTITVNQGTLASLIGTDTINTVNSQITVIAADGKGAALSTVSYPPGYNSAVRYPAIDVTSNGIANWVGDGVTDNADAMLELTAFGRGTQAATVNVSTTAGTSTVTQTSGTQFTGLAPGSPIIIDGLINSIASVTDATHLVTSSTVEGGATLTGVQLLFPPWVVNTSGTTVTAVSGPTFVGETGNIIIGQTTYTISSVTDATHLVLTTSAPTLSSVKMYEDPASCCSSGSGGSNPQNFYIPAGTYATSQPFHLYLNYWQLTGAGPQSSIIKLLPNSPAFNTGTATEFINPQSVGGNQNFHQFLYNLGIEIGRGNPNAIPLTSEMNNVAAIRNVQVWADDSVCPYALDLRRGFPGPFLSKNLALYGCTNAISSNQNEYLETFEGLTVEGQLGLVVDPTSNQMAFRHVLSDNPGQFLKTGASAPYGVQTVLDSSILNGGASNTGITVASGGAAYVKNLTVSGYLHSIVDSSTGTAVTVNGNVVQSWSGAAQSLFGGAPQGSIGLPVNETPLPSDPSPSTWTALDANVANWPTEISGSASTTVYAPPGGYNTTSGSTVTINIPDTVNHLQFYQSKRSDNNAYTLQINVAGTSTTPFILDGCIYTSCNVVHTGTRTVVLLDSTLNQYTASPGAGDLYIEDSILAGTASTTVPTFQSSQHVWARHLNLEAHNINKFDCEGCTIWTLGYKTEEPFPNIILNGSAKGEFFGNFFYSNVAPSQPSQILITDSQAFIASVLDKVDVAGRGNADWVTETQGTVARSLATSTQDSSINLSNYYSIGPTNVPTFSPPAGSYTGTQTVSVSCPSGLTCFYTTDGSTPSLAGFQYTSPITVSSSQTIKVIAASVGVTSRNVGNTSTGWKCVTTNGTDYSPPSYQNCQVGAGVSLDPSSIAWSFGYPMLEQVSSTSATGTTQILFINGATSTACPNCTGLVTDKVVQVDKGKTFLLNNEMDSNVNMLATWNQFHTASLQCNQQGSTPQWQYDNQQGSWHNFSPAITYGCPISTTQQTEIRYGIHWTNGDTSCTDPVTGPGWSTDHYDFLTICVGGTNGQGGACQDFTLNKTLCGYTEPGFAQKLVIQDQPDLTNTTTSGSNPMTTTRSVWNNNSTLYNYGTQVTASATYNIGSGPPPSGNTKIQGAVKFSGQVKVQ